ncbi:MAG: hypothetical protein K0Q63_3367 [Paenibacillus sp.]|nr:hypothetical protein [Paenibacillus sp.]
MKRWRQPGEDVHSSRSAGVSYTVRMLCAFRLLNLQLPGSTPGPLMSGLMVEHSTVN